MAKRVPKAEVAIAAARVVKSGDIHEAGGGRVGYYADGGPNAAIGQRIVVHTDEVVEITAPTGLVLAVNALVNFDFTTQAAVASGGTNIGRAVYAKASGPTTVVVALNNTGMVVS